LSELVGMFDAQMAAAAKLGPSIQYVRLQMALARCEVHYDKSACENRLIGLFYEIAEFPDVGVRTEALAWLSDGVSELEGIAPYSAQFAVGTDVATELDSSFLALLDGTADHYRAAAGVIKALTHRHFEKALDLVSMLNTQSRKDRALADIVDALLDQGAEGRYSAKATLLALSKIEDRYRRDDAVFRTVESLTEEERGQPVIDDDLRQLLGESCNIGSADTRCLACANAYVLLCQVSRKEWPELLTRLLDCMGAAWRAIDTGWLRVVTGFKIAQTLASVSPDISATYLEQTETFRAGIGGLASPSADSAYVMCLRLAIRAFSGLVPKRGHTVQDLESLALLIGGVPSAGERAILWADLALRSAVYGNKALCAELVNERLRPSLAGVSEDDSEYRCFVVTRCAAALYEANPAAAMGILQKLELPYRDYGICAVVSYLFRKQAPEEPEEYVFGTGYNVEYGKLLEICELGLQLDSDARIYDLIERAVDCLVSKTISVTYNVSQREEVCRRLQEIVKVKLPAPRHIRHDGYKVIARAQLARFRNDSDLNELVSCAERIPNTADRALVMFTTGLAVSKYARSVADRLLRRLEKRIRCWLGSFRTQWTNIQQVIGRHTTFALCLRLP
jgi:hypothetical protein